MLKHSLSLSHTRTHRHRWWGSASSIREWIRGWIWMRPLNCTLLLHRVAGGRASPVAHWAVASVQTAPCAHSALNGPWNQSPLTAIMPFNIQHGPTACARDYQGIVCTLCRNTHSQLPGASCQSSAGSISTLLILQNLVLKGNKWTNVLLPSVLLLLNIQSDSNLNAAHIAWF